MVYSCATLSSYWLLLTKSVYRVSDKVGFKPVSSATETSKKIEISPVASLHMILSKSKNKGADQPAQRRRLVCACSLALRSIL